MIPHPHGFWRTPRPAVIKVMSLINELCELIATIFEKKSNISCGNLQITGLACIAVGIWMNADPYVISYFVVLKRGTHDDALLGASAVSCISIK